MSSNPNQEDKSKPDQEVKPAPKSVDNFWVKYKWWIVLLLLCVLLLWLYMKQTEKSPGAKPLGGEEGVLRQLIGGADLNIASPIDDIPMATTGVPKLF